MKVTEKKLDDGRILLEAVASTAEVSHALTAAQYRFAQQMGVQPTPGMSVEQAVEKQLGIKDLDAIVQQQAVEYLVPFAIDKRNITPAFPALPKAAGPLKRGQTFSFEVRVTPKPDYELKSYEPVSITVPPFEIEQAEVEEQIAQILHVVIHALAGMMDFGKCVCIHMIQAEIHGEIGYSWVYGFNIYDEMNNVYNRIMEW